MDQAAPAASYTGAKPVALSAGQSGSAREQQSLRTWIVSFLLESAVNQLAHSSGDVVCILDFRLDPWFLLCCNALQVLCGDEELWEHLTVSADTFQFGAVEAMHSI